MSEHTMQHTIISVGIVAIRDNVAIVSMWLKILDDEWVGAVHLRPRVST